MKLNNPFLHVSLAAMALLCTINTHAQSQGTVITTTLTSRILQENKVGLDPSRKVKVYLPPGYAGAGHSYPVVYYFPSMANPDTLLKEGDIPHLLDQAFEKGVVKPFIFVIADYSGHGIGSFYENSIVSGRWLDFTAKELIPFVDSQFHTLKNRESRALVGHFMGGRGALKLAMDHPELFSVVYAMHPVATGMGYQPWSAFPADWKKILNAKSQGEVTGNFVVGLSQAFLPNPNRPPLYCDFFQELEKGEPRPNAENIAIAQNAFLLDHGLAASAAGLRSMRAIAFDWARYDANQDHIYSVRAFATRLEDLGVEHEAEEYRGDPWSRIWGDNGRFCTRVLPFINRNLAY